MELRRWVGGGKERRGDGRGVRVATAPLAWCSFTAPELALHCREGEPDAGFVGHPLCRLCDRRFYGETELVEHLVRGRGGVGWRMRGEARRRSS